MKRIRKNVLITGADGFIGSHLTEKLLDLNYNVRALSYYNSFNNWGWLEEIPHSNNLEIISGDIRDPYLCNTITKNVDIVFNLAALIAIPYSYIAPSSYIDTNVKGTLNICQAALENNVNRIIHISTSEVYGTAVYVPIDEKHPIQPQSPYSASKIGADAIAMSYYNTFELPLTIARPFNTYGPRQSARAVIPTIIIQLASGVDEIKLGDVSPTRDLNYVEDTCHGLIEILNNESSIGKEINIATNVEYSIKKVFELISNILKSKAKLVLDEQRIRPSKSEVFRLLGDNSLIRKLTSFEPKYDLESGLIETCRWYTKPENLNRFKAQIYNV